MKFVFAINAMNKICCLWAGGIWAESSFSLHVDIGFLMDIGVFPLNVNSGLG
jgi:hypothetical protein